MTPIRISTTLITIASTGRRMEVSERIIWRALFCWRRLRVGGCHLHCRAIVQLGLAGGHDHIASGQPGKDFDLTGQPFAELHRSEEHTSELQSLMRISYAVFCLKKNTRVKQI